MVEGPLRRRAARRFLPGAGGREVPGVDRHCVEVAERLITGGGYSGVLGEYIGANKAGAIPAVGTTDERIAGMTGQAVDGLVRHRPRGRSPRNGRTATAWQCELKASG